MNYDPSRTFNLRNNQTKRAESSDFVEFLGRLCRRNKGTIKEVRNLIHSRGIANSCINTSRRAIKSTRAPLGVFHFCTFGRRSRRSLGENLILPSR